MFGVSLTFPRNWMIFVFSVSFFHADMGLSRIEAGGNMRGRVDRILEI